VRTLTSALRKTSTCGGHCCTVELKLTAGMLVEMHGAAHPWGRDQAWTVRFMVKPIASTPSAFHHTQAESYR
jgi:hypothetical protein